MIDYGEGFEIDLSNEEELAALDRLLFIFKKLKKTHLQELEEHVHRDYKSMRIPIINVRILLPILESDNLIDKKGDFWNLTGTGLRFEGYLNEHFQKALDKRDKKIKEKKMVDTKNAASKETKIFISHSSKDADYGEALVGLMTGIGIRDSQIIFTSNVAYGIPNGKNIFDWLKNEIIEKPFVIYLLSPSYYKSVACLNEMGAAWIVENEHVCIFTPSFDLDSPEYRNGAIDPRKIGFRVNHEDRLFQFVETLQKTYGLSSIASVSVINTKVKAYLNVVNNIQDNEPSEKKITPSAITKPSSNPIIDLIRKEKPKTPSRTKSTKTIKHSNQLDKLIFDINNRKLNDIELMLIHYIIDSGSSNLMSGWQEDTEIDNIKEWEGINNLNDLLSKNYGNAIKRFTLRNYIEVSAVTGAGKPKEYSLVEDIKPHILELPDECHTVINEIIEKCIVS